MFWFDMSWTIVLFFSLNWLSTVYTMILGWFYGQNMMDTRHFELLFFLPLLILSLRIFLGCWILKSKLNCILFIHIRNVDLETSFPLRILQLNHCKNNFIIINFICHCHQIIVYTLLQMFESFWIFFFLNVHIFGHNFFSPHCCIESESNELREKSRIIFIFSNPNLTQSKLQIESKSFMWMHNF